MTDITCPKGESVNHVMKRSQLQLIMSHLLPLRIEVGWMNVDSLKKEKVLKMEAPYPTNLLGPPLSCTVRSACADNFHLPVDRTTKSLSTGTQVNPRVYVLELDCLVALPVVSIAHNL